MANITFNDNLTTILVVSLFFFGFLFFKQKQQTQVVVKREYVPVEYTSRMIPINVRTRGLDHYKRIGILSGKDGVVLPLYGRRTYNGSHRWHYYTMANDHLTLEIPLVYKGRNCTDNNGCDELYSGDTINIEEYNTTFTVKIYNTSPRYIPY